MILSIELVFGTSLLYVLGLFLVASYADKRQELGRSIISNPLVYSLSIGVYATTWTYYGSVGRAATTGIDFLLIYLGPTLTTFAWWFLLRKIVRISKENNITSIADFISSRYGKSQLLGALVTIIAIIGIMPYIGLQLKAVSTTFDIICGYPYIQLPFKLGTSPISVHTSFLAALFFSIFGIIFGARNLVSSERHEGLVAAIAVESVVKLLAFMVIGLFVTYGIFDGFGDIFARIKEKDSNFYHLVTINEGNASSHMNWLTTLWLSMGAIMLLPRQFHVAVIENSDEKHIKTAMWLFPVYLFLINLFVIPLALGGILYSGGISGADYFVLNLPLQSGHPWLALLAFLGGFSAAAGMVIVESVAISTMFLNHLVMPVVVRLKPKDWFPGLLINLKRFGIFLVVFLGYIYQNIVGETYMLVNIGLISFAAVIQFGPALLGGLYWRRGNMAGAITGIFIGFALWFYTLLVPSLIKSGWWHMDILTNGPFGIGLLKPTELFGLTGLDILSHSFFWSMFLNTAGYMICSILFTQNSREADQANKFVDIFMPAANSAQRETNRLTKPVDIEQFVNLLSKFIGESQASDAIREYQGNRTKGGSDQVSEFELPKLKRFAERTLAGSVGAAAAGAIIESHLSDLGSRMESVYDVFSTVRSSLMESKEILSVRLRASEIMSRTLDLPVIMDELLDLIRREFKFDLVIIRLLDEQGILTVRSQQSSGQKMTPADLTPDNSSYAGESFTTHRVQVVNDTRNLAGTHRGLSEESEGMSCFAHIPIARSGEPPMGILSLCSRTLVGVFTEEFINLLSSLAGQLAQAVTIVSEMEARQRERLEKDLTLLQNARVAREMEIARQIQFSLLPYAPPELPGVGFAGTCIPAAHVGGDYYDFFVRGEDTIDVIIADVSGHSVGAALIMAETRSLLRARVYSATTAPEALSLLNEQLYEDLTSSELFITMFYVKYNIANHMLSYANAGHNRPLLFRKGETTCIELDAEGMILGVRKSVPFEDKNIQLFAGDLLLLYTDGITEAMNSNGDFFGIGRLCELLAENHEEQPQQIIEAVLDAVSAFCESSPLQDDISMVVLKIM